MTGNTVIDAFKTTVRKDYQYKNEQLRNENMEGRRVVLVTAHRRENLGEPLEIDLPRHSRIVSGISGIVVHLSDAFRILRYAKPHVVSLATAQVYG